MTRLAFIVPVAGRESLTRVCLRQLRRTCDALTTEGIQASAIVIGDDRNLHTALELGFGTVIRNNWFLARKFNDGIELACNGGADYVVPCGSDDWVDHRLFLTLPKPNEVLCFRHAAFVNEAGDTIVSRRLDYPGGVGIRVYPHAIVKRLRYRPADEDRKRGCDTSILVNLGRTYREPHPPIRYGDIHGYQVVDWKTKGEQLNSFRDITVRHSQGASPEDPFEALADLYPAEALKEMRAHYTLQQGRVAA